jgi:sugar/nucleoside kinase (ribokinase family)
VLLTGIARLRILFRELPGETLVSNDFGIFQGGKGANQAIALAELDVPTLMLGKVGEDALNDFALRIFWKLKVFQFLIKWLNKYV